MAAGEFYIEAGTCAILTATEEDILLRPVTTAPIKRGWGIIKRTPGEPPLSEWWAEHKRHEKELEAPRPAQRSSSARR